MADKASVGRAGLAAVDAANGLVIGWCRGLMAFPPLPFVLEAGST